MGSSLMYDTAASAGSSVLTSDYMHVRGATAQLIAGLHPEDTVAQSMPDASPTKWHLAHTTWFFEQFVLCSNATYRVRRRKQRDAKWLEMFNSYYQSVGAQYPRARRSLLTRPTLAEVMDYRDRIDDQMLELLERDASEALHDIVQLGLHHERQHQELILTDIKHLFSCNPLEPAYYEGAVDPDAANEVALQYIEGRNGIVEIGCSGPGFFYDNECPRHRVILQPHAIANRTVNNEEYRSFIEDGGYRDARLWMAEGWDIVQREQWQCPLYWSADLQTQFTLHGRQTINPLAPVTHLSFFEADAYARWAGARLPTEAEWETMASGQPDKLGNFMETNLLQPRPPASAARSGAMLQVYGDVWEWTSSPYLPYPGFRPLPGAAGEYNGKFMSSQWVLRGGSCATPAQQMRPSYRNYFPPTARWQFSGLRLARDL